MKDTTHNLYEPVERQHYKKRYLQRRLEEEDAKREIKNYRPEEVSDTPPMDEKGTERAMLDGS